jgi:hypothetical protein
MKKEYKLGTNVNICLGPLPGPWKGPVQERGLKFEALLASW